MKTFTTAIRATAVLLWFFAGHAGAQTMQIEWQRLLADTAADYRFKDAVVDESGRIVVLHTRRVKGAGIGAGRLALWRVAAGGDRRVDVELPAEHGARHEGADAVPLVVNEAGVLAILVRTMTGLSLIELDGELLELRRARHLRGDAEPLGLQALDGGNYRLMTTRGFVLWPADGDPLDELRLAPDTFALATAVTTEGIAVLAVRRDPAGAFVPLVGLHGTGRGERLRLRPTEAGVTAIPGRTPFFGGSAGVTLFYPLDAGPPSHWRRLQFDQHMNPLASNTFELPFKAGMRTSLAPSPHDASVLLASGGERAYWAGRLAAGGRTKALSLRGDAPASGEWQFALDLQALPKGDTGKTVLAATYVYANRESQRVDYGIHIALLAPLALEDGRDAHAPGGADRD